MMSWHSGDDTWGHLSLCGYFYFTCCVCFLSARNRTLFGGEQVVANGGTRAVGWLVQGHWTQIHFLTLWWPQHDSLVPKVMPYPSFSANQWSTCTPALPHPLSTHTVSLNEGSHPPACTPSWAWEASSFTVSGDPPPTVFTPPWNYFYLAYFPPSLHIKSYTIYILYWL